MSLALLKQIVTDLSVATEYDDDAPFTFAFTVQEAFDQRDETYPRVIVRQPVNRPKTIVTADTRSEMEATTYVGFQLEVYSRDAIGTDGKVYDRTDVGLILVDELQQWFWNKLGLQRNTWSPSGSIDDATVRSVFRVNGVIDRHGYIYKS